MKLREEEPEGCKADGCAKLAQTAGYCSGHYHRLRRYGDPLFAPKKGFTAVEILSPALGDALAKEVIGLRDEKGRTKKFDAYRARITLAMFERASDPRLAAWEYVNRASNRKCLTVEYLRAVVDYDRATGVFRARIPMGKRQEGDILGSVGSHGYLSIAVAGKAHLAHRLAWFYERGEWPELIDHIDRDRHNNSISNLRECTHLENAWNVTPRKGTVSGVEGVNWFAARRKWVAKISSQGIHRTLGYFDTIEEAARVRSEIVNSERGHFLNAGNGENG